MKIVLRVAGLLAFDRLETTHLCGAHLVPVGVTHRGTRLQVPPAFLELPTSAVCAANSFHTACRSSSGGVGRRRVMNWSKTKRPPPKPQPWTSPGRRPSIKPRRIWPRRRHGWMRLGWVSESWAGSIYSARVSASFISRDVDRIGAALDMRSEPSSSISGRLCLDFVVNPRNRQVSGVPTITRRRWAGS